MRLNKINIDEIAGGGFQEQFQKSFEKIIENLKDPNTSFRDKRKMVITLTFAQDENREDVMCGIAFNEKLAPRNIIKTQYSIGEDLTNGRLDVREYGPGTIPGQIKIDDYVAEQTIDGKIIDTDTGEVIGQTQPIDLRRKDA